jgi:hypothetical protein
MEYLSVDDRYTSKKGQHRFLVTHHRIHIILTSITDSTEENFAEDEVDSPEIDPVATLLRAFPEDETVVDPNLPLTQSEISGLLFASSSLVSFSCPSQKSDFSLRSSY